MRQYNKTVFAYFIVILAILVLTVALVSAKPSTRAAKACDDGQDNDGDGYIDYPDDPGCSSKNDKSELNPEIECDDGDDNDGDGDTDMDDAGCSGPTDDDESNCGDEVCEGSETQQNCPEDCGYPDSCSDTDGGNFPFTFGTTSGYFNEIFYSHDDYCVDSSNIMEYYCSGDYEQSQQQSCGTDGYGSDYCIGESIYQDFTDYFCSSGECDLNITPVFQEDCDSYDGYGSDYCIGDYVYSNYTDAICSSGDCDLTNSTPVFQEDCDSYDYYGDNYCNGSSVYRDFYNYYCSVGNCYSYPIPEFVEYCTYGCTNGTCDPIPDSCYDSDGGFTVNIFGNTTGFLNEQFYSNPDFCATNTTLVEFYCIGDYSYNNTYDCSTNYTMCSGGKCI